MESETDPSESTADVLEQRDALTEDSFADDEPGAQGPPVGEGQDEANEADLYEQSQELPHDEEDDRR
ncbi:MAG: hypothetical protein ACRDY3_01750 [Acidimicrobiales bacterium]